MPSSRHRDDPPSTHHRGQRTHITRGPISRSQANDNRPENLELWTRPQPSGIRVSDAIEWARMILDRYQGAGAPATVLTADPEHSWRWGGVELPHRLLLLVVACGRTMHCHRSDRTYRRAL